MEKDFHKGSARPVRVEQEVPPVGRLSPRKFFFRMQTALAFANAAQFNDFYTGNHCRRVVHVALAIASQLSFSEAELEDLNLAAVLHDIGKMGIPEKILNKSEPLTDAEFELIKQHPEMGVDILAQLDDFSNAVAILRHHHERPDGKGYPCGLSAAEIPLASAVLSVADTYDAITQDRPYRKAQSTQFAREEIFKNRGSQFDARAVDAFAKAFDLGLLS